MGILNLFKKKKDEPIIEKFSQFANNIDMSQILISTPNPRYQRVPLYMLTGECKLEVNKSNLIPSSFTKTCIVPFPLGSKMSRYNEKPIERAYYHLRKNVMIEENMIKDIIFLHIVRISGEYTVYVNGQKAASGSDDYNVEIEIQSYVKQGINTLDFTFRKSKCEYVGITGPMYYDSVGVNYIKSVGVSYNIQETEVTFDIDMLDPRGTITIYSPAGTMKDYIFNEKITTIRLDDFIKWDIKSPYFYQYEVKASGDTIKGIFSIADVRLSKMDKIHCLTINGKPYPIKGILDNYFYTDGLITTPSYECIDSILKSVKSFGFNAIYVKNRIELPYYFYMMQMKGLLSAVHINFDDEETFSKELEYLSDFDIIFCFIIENRSKKKNEEIYSLAKSIVDNKLVLVNKKGKTVGDFIPFESLEKLKSFKNKEDKPCMLLSLDYDDPSSSNYVEFMKKDFGRCSKIGMIGHFYSSLNAPSDGIFTPDYKSAAHHSVLIKEYQKGKSS